MKSLFTASATAVGGRNGHSEASDKSVSVDLSIPKSMGGPGKPNTTTPEHLFATGYSACFGSAVEFVARLKHVPLTRVEVTADVTLNARDDGGFALSVALRVKLDGVPADKAKELMEAAHTVCPYSNAIKGNVPVTLALA